MTTPNLALAHVAAAQNQKEVPINAGLDGLDRATHSSTAVDCSAGGTISVSLATMRATTRLLLNGSPAASFTLELGSMAKPLIIRNITGQTAIVQQPTGDSVEVPDAAQVAVYAAGAGVFLVGGVGGGGGGALDDLDDVSAASPSSGDVLYFDGADWINEPFTTFGRALLPYKGALTKRTSNLIGFTSGIAIPWEDVAYDTDGFWSGGAPSRLTVPAGVTKVRITAGISLALSTNAGSLFAVIIKNGSSSYDGQARFNNRNSTTGFTNNQMAMPGAVVEVTAGDYFELLVSYSAAAYDDVLVTGSWLCIEVVETTAAKDPPFDVSGYAAGVPGSSQILLRIPVARDVLLAEDLAGSYGVASVAATAETNFDVQKNGASVGTMRFAAAATTATFIAASEVELAPGDILSVVAPASPDATLAGVGFTLAGTLVV